MIRYCITDVMHLFTTDFKLYTITCNQDRFLLSREKLDNKEHVFSLEQRHFLSEVTPYRSMK